MHSRTSEYDAQNVWRGLVSHILMIIILLLIIISRPIYRDFN